jgi:hypothetical protein
MSLENTLTNVIARLREQRPWNALAISVRAVRPVLQELGWDTEDDSSVCMGYQTDNGGADFALCHPPSEPAVFTWVKPPAEIERAVPRALEFAYDSNVRLVALTDGRTWSFYLPEEQDTEERGQVGVIDLLRGAPAKSAETLARYLTRAEVESGAAIERARQDCLQWRQRAEARAAIPETWRKLVEQRDELLVHGLADAVVSSAGGRPNDDDVIEFLGKLVSSDAVDRPSDLGGKEPGGGPGKGGQVPKDRRGSLQVCGRPYPYANAKEAMVIVLRELARNDPTLLQRCAEHAQGTKRRYIARSPEEIYPDAPHLRGQVEPLPEGWFVATNLNNDLKMRIIRWAAEVASLTFGKDIIVEF